MVNNRKYTCIDYREEMMLLGLKRRLNQRDLSEKEKRIIIKEIKKLESEMQID
jgi:hypothetical protein